MPTKRTPIRRHGRHPITDELIALFRKMERLKHRCECSDVFDGNYCSACEDWFVCNEEMCELLNLPPWEFPAYATSDETGAHPDAIERYDALRAASTKH